MALHSESGLALEESDMVLRWCAKLFEVAAMRAAASTEKADATTRVLRESMRRFMPYVG